MNRCIHCGIWTDYGITCSNCRPDPLDETYNQPSEEDQWENDVPEED